MGVTKASGITPSACIKTCVLGKVGGQSRGLFSKSLIYEVPMMTILILSSASTISCTLMTALSIWCVPNPHPGSGHTDNLTERNRCAHAADVLMGDRKAVDETIFQRLKNGSCGICRRGCESLACG